MAKIAKYSLLIALGITLPNLILADFDSEISYRDDFDKRDYNRSTTTVNRSSDVRPNRTMDTRPLDNYTNNPIDSRNAATGGDSESGAGEESDRLY